MAKRTVGDPDPGRAARDLIRAGDQYRLTGSKAAAERVRETTAAYDRARGK